MPSRISVSIPQPCHASWQEMLPDDGGRYCNLCQKTVVDFTGKSEAEIATLLLNAKGKTCGRFRQEQLTPLPFVQTTKKLPRWQIYLLTLGTVVGLKSGFTETLKAQTPTEQPDSGTSPVLQGKLAPVRANDSTLVTGKVLTAADQLPLAGVNVVMKGTTHGTITDADGNYSLTIPTNWADKRLVFSFIGFVTAEVAPQELQPNKPILLKEDHAQLGEVVVIAGGVITVRKFSPRWFWWKIRSPFVRLFN